MDAEEIIKTFKNYSLRRFNYSVRDLGNIKLKLPKDTFCKPTVRPDGSIAVYC
jgi:hypothetical protein